MRIEPGNAAGLKSNSKENDYVLESIQKQIIKLQDQLKCIDADRRLTIEEKNDQKKLIYDQISNLRQQYSQRELALIQEQQKQQQKQEKMEVFTEDENDSEAVVLDGNLAAMMTAGVTLNSVRSSRSVKAKLEAEERTLNSEIKTDSGRGLGVSEKVLQRNELSDNVQDVMDFLAVAVKQTHEALDETKDEEDKHNRDEQQKSNNGHVDVLI